MNKAYTVLNGKLHDLSNDSTEMIRKEIKDILTLDPYNISITFNSGEGSMWEHIFYSDKYKVDMFRLPDNEKQLITDIIKRYMSRRLEELSLILHTSDFIDNVEFDCDKELSNPRDWYIIKSKIREADLTDKENDENL